MIYLIKLVLIDIHCGVIFEITNPKCQISHGIFLLVCVYDKLLEVRFLKDYLKEGFFLFMFCILKNKLFILD